MKRYLAFSVIVRIFASVLLFWAALSHHPSGYYTLLRWVVFGVGVYSAYIAVTFNRIPWAWCFGLIALFFNPLIPVWLNRATWVNIDVAVGVVFLISIFFVSRRTKKSTASQAGTASEPSQRYTSVSLPKGRSKKKIATSYVSGIPADFEMTPELSRTFNLMENSKENLFITGKAGTGKSVLLQYFKEKTKKKIVVVAPTGVAALNVGGSTIHSFFQLPPRLLRREDVRVIPKKRKLFHSLDALVVDEVSMVRADLMDAIDHSLRTNRNRLHERFGGVQTILFGDLYQLSPVVEPKLNRYFADTYESPFFFSADVIKQAQPSKIELQRVFRQTDPQFIELLNKIRKRQVTAEELQVLNERSNPIVTSGKDELVINLTSTNELAYGINHNYLNSLPSHDYYFNAVITGDFDEKSYPTDKRLRLKKGAQVMMVKNDPDKRWVNGSLGIIENISQHSIRVSLGRASYQVRPVTWEKIDYEYNPEEGKIEPVETGTFCQYPIKLAWAITIHKSQGKTFEKEIIDLGNGAFVHGQVYVALSRCRSFQGIQVKTPIKLSDIILDERVVDFLSQGNGA